MGPIGVPEMLFILAIALLIFGPKRLPELGRTIGKALGEFRRATTDLKRSIDVEINAAETNVPKAGARAASTAPAPVAREGGAGGVVAADAAPRDEERAERSAEAEPGDGPEP